MIKAKKFAADVLGMVDVNDKEALELALAQFNTEAKEKATFGDVALEDGTLLYFPGDVLEVGSAVFTDETQETPAGAGEYILESGETLVINEEGLVTEIVPANEEEETPAEDAPAEDAPAEEEGDVLTEIFEALGPKFEEIEARLATLEGSNADLTAENEKLKATNEKLSKAPAAKPHTETKKFNKTTKLSKAAPGSVRAKLGL